MAFLRPMLAAPLMPPDIEHTDEAVLAAMKKLRYPVIASLKMDGIRAIRLSDLYSRTLKLIPNKSIRARSVRLPPGFDVELWFPLSEYHEVESIVMSREHEQSEKIGFWILDNAYDETGYANRMATLDRWLCDNVLLDVFTPTFMLCATPEELLSFEKKCIDELGEGICFRTLMSPYKQGRSTLREQYLVKLSRYVRTEVTIVGFEEQMFNGNRAKSNAIGMMDRSSSQFALISKQTLGAFVVKDGEHTFRVGTGVGLTDQLRLKIWIDQENYLGKTITIKHKPHGKKIKPRSPIFVGFREKGF